MRSHLSLWLVGFLDLAAAYTTNVMPALERQSSIGFFFHRKLKLAPVLSSRRPRETKVNLGLKKGQNVQTAVKYLNECQSVREYPNPTHQRNHASHFYLPQPEHDESWRKKTLSSCFEPIVPEPMNEKYFEFIMEATDVDQHANAQYSANPEEETQLLQMTLKHPDKNSFEVDTPWIEMLIHEQRVKYASTAV